MEGWGKLIAGALIGAAGTVYATNEEFRKRLPEAARNLPGSVRDRFVNSVAAAREASATRRAEILKELETHGGTEHELRSVNTEPAPPISPPETPLTDAPEPSNPPAKDLTGTTPAKIDH